MCTAIILQRVVPGRPVVVAANRDEFLARAARPPRVIDDGPPRIVGGIDEARGGTWLGVSAAGGFAMVTNQRDPAGNDPARRSRGELVVELLRAGDAAAMRRLLAGLDATAYNPFNLLFGDAGGLHVGYGRRDRPAIALAAVPDGVSVLPNDDLESPAFPKVGRAHALIDDRVAAPWDALRPALLAALADHARPPLEAIAPPPPGAPPWWTPAFARELQALCIHTPAYGTRSASLVALAPGRVVDYWYADGPPCTAAAASQLALVG